ncbi:aminotransferase class I/II-fold pyridoxal phosphate-dependent enzyme [Echinicola rosea]|uniref:8-amino-7-oxononanoate synthase n=1 Tax=Echinicola rosea TaxID=1807691 RepID=A0ABQ1ULD7_9BACT|nr:pyridoxal phosphate-dependent aminotransferase family protein [Echinicola rosea]GGF19601.1 8-amino-7-oxononanoate synthase [Echinicola rosea]
MEKHHQFIRAKLDQAAAQNRLRTLKTVPRENTDFFSNDYLGYATKGFLAQLTSQLASHWTGATGSRLISGNHPEMEKLERDFASFMDSPAALLYNSGYMANTGLLSSLGEKDSLFIFDEHVHASIKEGMRLGFGQKTAFKHNDLKDLEKKLTFLAQKKDKRLMVLTEGLFSMHGDIPDIGQMLGICQKYGAALIIDEAHSLGTVGKENKGTSHRFAHHPNLLARVITFGKAAGGHGAMVLGSDHLRSYLVNYSRSFIYTTAPSLGQLHSIGAALELFASKINFDALEKAIDRYLDIAPVSSPSFSNNQSPIQYWQCDNIPLLKAKVNLLQKSGINCYPILSPTVKTGEERIRIVLHAFNTKEEISNLINILNA